MGKPSAIGTTPAVVKAVADAFTRNGLAARAPKLQMPLTSSQVSEMVQAR